MGKVGWRRGVGKGVYSDGGGWVGYVDEEIVIEGKRMEYEGSWWDK